MTGQTIILGTERAAKEALRVILNAPSGSVLKVSAPRRSIDQNSKLWAMLSDVSRAKPAGPSPRMCGRRCSCPPAVMRCNSKRGWTVRRSPSASGPLG
jgi:hypothetical protein